MSMRLNLGCGFDHKPQDEGWVNIDINPSKNPDVIWNLEGMPFLPGFTAHKDNNIDEILMKHCLEHLNQANFFDLMREFWYVCKPNAIITIIVPHWQQEAAFEPDHKWVYPPRSFRMIAEGYQHLVEPAKFEIVELIEKDNAKEPQTKVVYKVIK